MQRTFVLAFALVAGSALAAPTIPSDMPQPDPGLWELKTSIAEMGGMTMTFESCMDGSVEELLQRPEVEDADCQDMHIDYSNNRLTARAVCTVEGSRAEIVSEFTGDFRRAYQGEVRSTYTPPLQGMRQTTAAVEGRWIASECAPGQRPGDTRMKGGIGIPGLGDINLDDMLKNIPGMSR